MNYTPYPYQVAGIDWIIDHPACALFWGMGTGKTVTTLTALDALLAIGDARRVLVIAPLRVAQDTWTKEAGKWTHLQHLRVVSLCSYGAPARPGYRGGRLGDQSGERPLAVRGRREAEELAVGHRRHRRAVLV